MDKILTNDEANIIYQAMMQLNSVCGNARFNLPTGKLIYETSCCGTIIVEDVRHTKPRENYQNQVEFAEAYNIKE